MKGRFSAINLSSFRVFKNLSYYFDEDGELIDMDFKRAVGEEIEKFFGEWKALSIGQSMD